MRGPLPASDASLPAWLSGPADLSPLGRAVRGEGPGAPAVHVLRDRGVGDGLGRGLQAGLAAQAAAVAAETVKLPPWWVVGGDAPGLGVEGVVLIDVIIVPVPTMTRRTQLTMEGEGGSKAGVPGPGRSLWPRVCP